MIKLFYNTQQQNYYRIDNNSDDIKANTNIFQILLFNILNSDISIATYFVDICSKLIYKIDTIYQKYTFDINNQLKNDYRFKDLEIEYRSISIMDLLNNIYSTPDNKIYVYNYGYYYKYNETFINYIDSNLGIEYITDYKKLLANLKSITKKVNKTYYVNEKSNINYNKLYSNYRKDTKNICNELKQKKYFNLDKNIKIKINILHNHKYLVTTIINNESYILEFNQNYTDIEKFI